MDNAPWGALKDVKLCMHANKRVRFSSDGKLVAFIYCDDCGRDLMDSERWAMWLWEKGFHDH